EDTDARYKCLQLTDQGHNTVKKINHYADQQVMNALNHLLISEQKTIAQGLKFYAEALVACHKEKVVNLSQNIEIISGYRAGMIGRVTEMHGTYYSKNHNFGCSFEAKVAASVAEFSQRMNSDCNNIWFAIHNDQIIGSVAIDGEDLNNHEAHLRWFILDEDYQGYGVGRKLLNEAIGFCDHHAFSAVHLWTFSGLDAARKLYESLGFELVKEWTGDQWGKTVIEQQFTRKKGTQ
ncbi:GNAT family N-acetyltransferase, partial [Acinetobacter bereziniae]|uniref:GNAT family N-acetyltransferase n=1 Tax=Acinetobacter bereziniae TaxID=106648 RepID=UPI001902250D